MQRVIIFLLLMVAFVSSCRVINQNSGDATWPPPVPTNDQSQAVQEQTAMPTVQDAANETVDETVDGTADESVQDGQDACEAGDPTRTSPLADHQVYRALSTDAYTFEADGELLIDRASVPEGVMGPDGALWVYFINGEPGKHGLFVARETAVGIFETIDCVRLDGVFEGNAVDPDVVRLADGRYRLFYFLGSFVTPPQPGQTEHPIYSAISEDGLNFTVEGQLIAVEGVTDPSVVQLPNGRWLMALAQAEQNHTLLAASEDGHTFTLMDTIIEVGGIPELAVMSDGRVRLYLSRSLISDDGGLTWIEEPERFVPGPDPSLVAMPDGTFTMFYKKFANQPGGEPGNPLPQQTPGASDQNQPTIVAAQPPSPAPTAPGFYEVIYRQDEYELSGYLCVPEGAGPFAAVVYNHGGLGDAIGGAPEESCEALAQDGFVGFSPIRRLTRPLTGHLGDVFAGVEFVQQLDYVDRDRIGIMGFSRGGMLTFLAAAERPSDFKAIVIMASADEIMDGHLSSVDNISAPVLLQISENDNARQDHVAVMNQLNQELESAGKDTTLIIYPPYGTDGHFMFFEIGDYWEDVAAFLTAHLAPN